MTTKQLTLIQKTKEKEKQPNKERERKTSPHLSRTSTMTPAATIAKEDVLSAEFTDSVDDYIREERKVHSKIRNIRNAQRHGHIDMDTAREYWHEAIERILSIKDERNRLRWIPFEYKYKKHSASGEMGYSENREVANLRRKLEEYEQRTDLSLDMEKSGKIQELVNKRVKEQVARKEIEIISLQRELATKNKEVKKSPASLRVDFNFTDLVDHMRGLANSEDKHTMVIENSKIVKIE